jgi:uncharacterized protein
MLNTINLDEPVDIDVLATFLIANAETGCVTLSQLDGYLAGVVVSPTLLLPSAWLNGLWGEDGPPFADSAQANDVLGAIMRRYNEIIHQLNEGPAAYRPILGTGETRAKDTLGWGIGFIRALSFDPDAWVGVMKDRNGMACLAPILALAAEMPMSIDVSEFRLPKAELQKLIEGADQLLPMCVCGLRILCREPAERRATRRPKPSRRARRVQT